MKITVYFTLGDVLECENVQDTRKFWRMVSKHCKRVSKYDFFGIAERGLTERVVRVIKDNRR